MGAIPHSGNLCSGLCQTPCPHLGCWQCEEVIAKEERKKHSDPDCNDTCRTPCLHPACKNCFNVRFKADMKRKREAEGVLAAYKAQGTSVLSSVPSGRAEEKTFITRVALEELCKRAGIKVDWNDGDPILRDERGWRSATSWSSADMSPAQIKAKTFEDQVRAIADSALAGDLQRSIDEVAKAKAKKAEEEARQKLREQGASEADIEAAVTLMSWKPEEK